LGTVQGGQSQTYRCRVGPAIAGRDTDSYQFFITHCAVPHLYGRFPRFGEVLEGLEVVWMLEVGDVMTKVERVE